jgi:hypothetical protein
VFLAALGCSAFKGTITGNTGVTSGSGGNGPIGEGGESGMTGTGGDPGSGGINTQACDDTPEGKPGSHPDLTPGVWKNLTPPGIDLAGTFGTTAVTVDSCHRSVIYLSVDQRGLWKSYDGGARWTRLGNPSAPYNFDGKAAYLDSPCWVRVDPTDSNHLYAVQGVRGKTQGFWVSRDGGASWTIPPGFASVAKMTTNDVTMLEVDPSDFRHILVGSHSWWVNRNNGGVLESHDQGETWIVHPPVASWPGGSIGLSFLFDPVNKIGNNRTWLVSTDGNGMWRTEDAGGNWTQVSKENAQHGGAFTFRARNGALYTGGFGSPLRSMDNGKTWEKITKGLPYSSYYGIWGAGQSLYTMNSCPCGGGAIPASKPDDGTFYTSPDSDGTNWTPYRGGAQKFTNGPYAMAYDDINHILYASNWMAGFWALKILDP